MAETPREPDRFDKQAREVWASCLQDGDRPSHDPIAAALRAAESSALERAAHVLDGDPRDTITREVARWLIVMQKRIRALKPDPAAAPAHPMLEPLGYCDRPGFHDHPHRKQAESGTVNATGEPQGCINWRPAAPAACTCRYLSGTRFENPGNCPLHPDVPAPAAETGEESIEDVWGAGPACWQPPAPAQGAEALLRECENEIRYIRDSPGLRDSAAVRGSLDALLAKLAARAPPQTREG